MTQSQERRPANQQESEAWVFGSGADMYSWWAKFQPFNDWRYDPQTGQAPHGWAWLVSAENPEAHDPKYRTVMVTHSVVMGAARRIARGDFGSRDEVKRECWNLLHDVDAVDIDADTADQILRVAVLKKPFYG